MHLLNYTFRFEKKYYVHLLIFGKRSTQFGEQDCGKKLQRSEINGTCLKLIFNMYTDVKSFRIFHPCLTGVRQGEICFHFSFRYY